MEPRPDAAARAEELLAAYGQKLYQSRAAYADALLDDEIPDPPFYEASVRTKGSRRPILKRALILAAALILTLGTLLVSVDALRLKLSHFRFDEFPSHTKIIPSEKEEPSKRAMPDFRLGYVPEGYEMVNYDRDDSTLWVDYDNGKEQYIHFSVYYAADVSPSVDNDTLIREEARVGEYQAWYFHDELNSLVIWQMDEYLLTIDGGVSRDEIMKMAESVVK